MSEARDWCVLTLTEGGKLSVVTGLSAAEAQQTAQQVSPPWMRPNRPGARIMLSSSEGSIKMVHVFRGCGEVMDYWTGETRRREPFRI